MNNILSTDTALKNNSYRIQRLLGQGGFGAVYLADDLIMNRSYAIKEGFGNPLGFIPDAINPTHEEDSW